MSLFSYVVLMICIGIIEDAFFSAVFPVSWPSLEQRRQQQQNGDDDGQQQQQSRRRVQREVERVYQQPNGDDAEAESLFSSVETGCGLQVGYRKTFKAPSSTRCWQTL